MSANYPGYGNSTAQRCQRCGTPLSPNSKGFCGNCGMQNAPSQPNNSSGQLPLSSNPAWGGGQPQTTFGSGQSSQPGQSGQFGGPQWGIQPPSGSLGGSSIPQQPFGTQQSFSSPGSPSAPLPPFGNQQSFSSPPLPQQPFGTQQPFGGSTASQPFAATSAPQQPFGTQLPFSAQQSFGSPSAPLPPFGNQQSFGAQGTFSSPNNFVGVAGSSSQPNVPFAPQPQQPMAGNNFQQGNMNGYSPDDFEDPDFSDNKKKPKLGLIIGSIVLLIILVGAGIGGYSFLKSRKSTPPATTQSVTPTPTPKGPLLFQDTFQNNNKGWDTSGKPGELSVTVGHGNLTLEDDNNKLLWELIPGGKTFDNFLLNVDTVLSKGTQDNGYGVYIRGASNQTLDIATYYRFELYGDGTFAIFKGTLDASGISQSKILVNYTLNPAIQKQGKVNHISIVANGSTMSFTVNGQLLKTFTDNSYTSGSVALFVSNLANTTAGAQVKFSNLAMYPPQ